MKEKKKLWTGVLGIPFLDVVRVLAAVLILGNVGFTDRPGVEVGVIGENELASVAALLGVPPPALLRGLTSRTHNARGQLVKSVCDANMVCRLVPSGFEQESRRMVVRLRSLT